MLNRYLNCGERYRIYYVEGWQPVSVFNNRIEFGNMWHEAEEALSATGEWQHAIKAYASKLCDRFPLQQDEIIHWARMCSALFPVYLEYWASHPDTKKTEPLEEEKVFHVPYKLPSGRTVFLRGKRDGVVKTAGKTGGAWLNEHKTKTAIDAMKISQQLTFDLQTMFYVTALCQEHSLFSYITEKGEKYPIKGVFYNVIRRSSHKTPESMLKKVTEDLQDGRAGEWFSRWTIPVSAQEVSSFILQTLNPILENLCDDYEWWSHCLYNSVGTSRVSTYSYEKRHKLFPHHKQRHFRMPYTGYNPLAEGGESDIDTYLNTGRTAGLTRDNILFPELHTA